MFLSNWLITVHYHGGCQMNSFTFFYGHSSSLFLTPWREHKIYVVSCKHPVEKTFISSLIHCMRVYQLDPWDSHCGVVIMMWKNQRTNNSKAFRVRFSLVNLGIWNCLRFNDVWSFCMRGQKLTSLEGVSYIPWVFKTGIMNCPIEVGIFFPH